MTPESFTWMLEQQGGACAFCDKDAKCVDHDHADGTVRALLCLGCNLALGSAQENPQTLRRAADYIEAFGG